ncbi:hypothetical protein jhhlp_006240 [Lomentospora prolificans]|uniref:Metaxin glutathione S-transferase domain-containing protein n=1 Tax=Lomentospora prolificans TaxID=41688 RepID=A0A2N3N5E3_9PEZI|nr:hypothetical protein jhhlp_006240 [Lomentospora prolificans]
MPRQSATRSRSTSIFAVPEPIRRLFKRFPIYTYPENELPARCAIAAEDVPILFVFTDEQAAQSGAPSYNPTCLKWQPPPSPRAEPTSLPTRPPPRPASALYLSRRNFSLLASLYLDPAHPYPVASSVAHALCSAAEEEILASSRRQAVDVAHIYTDAQVALSALQDSLRDSETGWFFQEKGPTLFDASVFAYTNVLLDERLTWEDAKLPELLRRFDALVAHRERLLTKYWPEMR